ncbi:uridylate-specific endoribonuclease C-like isoform X2 [Entelurus aequoreus]|uniref:uridylate-specific endoribonuclease C-like isoform X2 n=1 Tax=Entelurus aequoreus TaxID=161455 RepID=UPI002B1DB7FD|nr:uridylate-specific endoribonuclease C-like isoform X2 [Entelurus aequoreus]
MLKAVVVCEDGIGHKLNTKKDRCCATGGPNVPSSHGRSGAARSVPIRGGNVDRWRSDICYMTSCMVVPGLAGPDHLIPSVDTAGPSLPQGANQELSEVLNELWHLDVNRLKPGTDYIISPQGRAGYVAQGSNYARDRARAPLFTYVNEDKLRSIKTYSHFINLLDNYEMSTGVSEKVTSEEFGENHKFLDAILETEVMKRAHQYLIQKRQSPPDLTHFKRQLYDIWFRLYHRDRSGGEDSCGFEHVFVGETKYGQEMMGLKYKTTLCCIYSYFKEYNTNNNYCIFLSFTKLQHFKTFISNNKATQIAIRSLICLLHFCHIQCRNTIKYMSNVLFYPPK